MLRPVLIASCVTMAAAASNGWLIVANKGDQTVGIIDPPSCKQVATVPEGGITAHEVVVSPDGRYAYAPIYGDSGVGLPGTDGAKLVVVDLAARKIAGELDFGHGVRPHCPLFGPKNGLLYVTTELDNTVSVIDPKTLKIVAAIPTGQKESHMLALSHDGRRSYTANVGPGTVSVLDVEAHRTLAVIPISRQTQRIAISPDDRMVFTSDQTAPDLVVIDTATNKVKTRVPLPAPGYGAAATTDGRWLLVAVPKANKVAVVDLRAMKVAATVDVPKAPQEVLIRPDQRVAYVSCDSSHQVAVITLGNWKLEALIEAGKGVDGLAWATVGRAGSGQGQ